MLRPAFFLACIAANAAALSGCTSLTCTLMSWPDVATMRRTLPRKPNAESAVVVESCRNGTCSTQRLVRNQVSWEPALGDSCFNTSSSDDGRSCAIIDKEGAIEVSWILQGKNPKTGDRFRVKVVEEKTSEVLLDESAIATFTETEHNGEGCGTTKSANL